MIVMAVVEIIRLLFVLCRVFTIEWHVSMLPYGMLVEFLTHRVCIALLLRVIGEWDRLVARRIELG